MLITYEELDLSEMQVACIVQQCLLLCSVVLGQQSSSGLV